MGILNLKSAKEKFMTSTDGNNENRMTTFVKNLVKDNAMNKAIDDYIKNASKNAQKSVVPADSQPANLGKAAESELKSSSPKKTK